MACFTAFADSSPAFADSFTAFADGSKAFFDDVGASAGIDEEEGALMEFEIPNWSDHWKSPVSAMILRP